MVFFQPRFARYIAGLLVTCGCRLCIKLSRCMRSTNMPSPHPTLCDGRHLLACWKCVRLPCRYHLVLPSSTGKILEQPCNKHKSRNDRAYALFLHPLPRFERHCGAISGLQCPLYARNLGIATDSSSERMANSHITRLWSKGTQSIHSRLCDRSSSLLELSRTSCSSFSHSHVVSFSASRSGKQSYRSLRVQTPTRVRPRSSDHV